MIRVQTTSRPVRTACTYSVYVQPNARPVRTVLYDVMEAVTSVKKGLNASQTNGTLLNSHQ